MAQGGRKMTNYIIGFVLGFFFFVSLITHSGNFVHVQGVKGQTRFVEWNNTVYELVPLEKK
jgi:hypothetical protein